MAGQGGNPVESGLHNRSCCQSVAFSAPVRGLVRGPSVGRFPHGPRTATDPETRRPRTHSGRRRPAKRALKRVPRWSAGGDSGGSERAVKRAALRAPVRTEARRRVFLSPMQPLPYHAATCHKMILIALFVTIDLCTSEAVTSMHHAMTMVSSVDCGPRRLGG